MHLERPLRPRQQLTGYAASPTGLEMSSADCSFRPQPLDHTCHHVSDMQCVLLSDSR